MRKPTKREPDIALVTTTASIAVISMLIAFYMSFAAEPLTQEIGYPRSILGYNRDWLVDGRWWFVAAAIFCVIVIVRAPKWFNR